MWTCTAALRQLGRSVFTRPQPLIESLSKRELEVLHLIAQGLSNQAIGERLFLALDTVKGHNRHIFNKLQVQRRTEAVARAASWVCCRTAGPPKQHLVSHFSVFAVGL